MKHGWARSKEALQSKPAGGERQVSERDRPPLPSGHPTAWAVLNEGTILQGTAYPLPVFP